MSDASGIQKRRYPRRRFSRPVGVLVGGLYLVREGLEISEGGMLVEAPPDIKVDAPLLVNFYIPGREFVTVRGTVVYVKPPSAKTNQRSSMGVKFQNLQFREKRFIRDYIADKTTVEANQLD